MKVIPSQVSHSHFWEGSPGLGTDGSCLLRWEARVCVCPWCTCPGSIPGAQGTIRALLSPCTLLVGFRHLKSLGTERSSAFRPAQPMSETIHVYLTQSWPLHNGQIDSIIIVWGMGIVSPKTGDDGEARSTGSYSDFYSWTVIFLRMGDTYLWNCLAVCREAHETKL